MQPKAPKTSTKTHRRSRTGCFTCRLRRKKCDEGKPCCRACKNLGLTCDYKRPSWWGNAEHRKQQKENIKILIKRTKLTEKAVHLSPSNAGSADSPPDLSYSVPTSDSYSDNLNRTRSLSVESGFSLDENQPFIQDYNTTQYFDNQQYYPQPAYQRFPDAGPFGYDGGQQKVFPPHHLPLASIPPRRSSTASTHTFSSSIRRDSIAPEPTFVATPEETFDFPFTDEPLPYIPVEDGDARLLDHFLSHVAPALLPILDLHNSARVDTMMPALDINPSFRHCCLAIAALHSKATQNLTGPNAEFVDQDITRHRFATISGLCESLAADTNHLQILEATLGMILFQTTVGSPDDSLPDIPWHQHFQAAHSLIAKLDLPRTSLHPIDFNKPEMVSTTLNMQMAAWIDILGGTMRGSAPVFADTYRDKHLNNTSAGLRELMGCDDRVMYLISEIACLEDIYRQNMVSDLDLTAHVQSLIHQLDLTEPPADQIVPPIMQGNYFDSRALTTTISAAFRTAARLYLISLLPSFDPAAVQTIALVDRLAGILEAIPKGWEKSVVWPCLIGGSVATEGSSFRNFFDGRNAEMGDQAAFGSWGKMKDVLERVWYQGGNWRANANPDDLLI